MSGAAVNQRHVGFPTKVTTATESNSSGANSRGNCNPVKQSGPASMEHVLIALRETKEERELRIKSLFNFFDVSGKGSLDFEQIEEGLTALNIPADYKYAKDLLKVCDADRDGKIGYSEFRRYMDDKELELYAIFQAIDVEHNGCILPEELWLALVNAGVKLLPCDQEVIGWSRAKQPLAEMQGKAADNDPKWSDLPWDPAQAGATRTGLPLFLSDSS